ncbi:hypothetical protein AWV80_16300 [Cupriavidus sp. UYMU48A]|nr:hypothetical protein AWV80_16300 [Cupriavidus sp. UYMU48A]
MLPAFTLTAEAVESFRTSGYLQVAAPFDPSLSDALLKFYASHAAQAAWVAHSPNSGRFTKEDRTDPELEKLRARADLYIIESVFSYCYRRLDIAPFSRCPPVEAILSVMQSRETIRTLEYISGHRLGRVRFVGITHYEQGDFLGPHADRSGADGIKAIAFNYCLVAPSDSQCNGDGALIYRRNHPEPDLALRPAAGSLIIFDVPRMGIHYVAPILKKREARISLVGFYYLAGD